MMVAWLFAVCASLITTHFAASEQISLPDCPSTCGNITIHYPFGIGTNCARKGLHLNCNHSTTPPKTYLYDTSDIELQSISLIGGQVRVRYYRVYDCYNKNGLVRDYTTSKAGTGESYTFSNLHNKFTVIGCDTYAYIMAANSSDFTSGCESVCGRMETIVNGSCSGIGCCQTAIPKGLQYYEIQLQSYYNHTKVWDFNPCSYAFLVDQDWFNFSAADLAGDSKYRSSVEQVPLVLDWVAGNETCEIARGSQNTYACRSENSECYESTSSATGYLCNCSSGFEGNPYLIDGCQDIDECKRKDIYPCRGTCINIQGGYDCICPKGHHGDPKIYECVKDGNTKTTIIVTIITCIVAAFLVIFLYGFFEKRKRDQLAKKLFEQNGGVVLEQHLKMHNHIQSMLRVFGKEELEKATNKFAENKVLGSGGQGTVYKGTLQDNIHIAIKKSTIFGEFRTKDFINEIIILSQINHKNVVRLLGCCLEVEIPYLVYEFIPNNTLFYHIHNQVLPWRTRLRIAADTAGALAHLHTKVAIPIYHQDVKSTNILLDWDYTAKVSDFGASKLILEDKEALNTLVKGTLGYLDPEYLQTHELTDKSDVYSFGVVLVELLTGREPISFQRGEKERFLAQHFSTCMEENRLIDILDPRILNIPTNNMMDQMMDVAKLALQCLNLKGKNRPDMMNVSLDLEGWWRCGDHRFVEDQVVDEQEHFLSQERLNKQNNNHMIYANSNTSTNDVETFGIGVGR